jgi:hypothetical protein
MGTNVTAARSSQAPPILAPMRPYMATRYDKDAAAPCSAAAIAGGSGASELLN